MPSDAPGRSPSHPAGLALERAPIPVSRLSLGLRVALVTVGAAVIASLVAAIVSFPIARESAQQESMAKLDQLADAAAAAIEQRQDRSVPLIPERLRSVLASEDITPYLISPRRELPSFLAPSDIRMLHEGKGASGEVDTDQGEVIYAVRPLTTGSWLGLTQPASVSRQLSVQTLNRFIFALAVGAAIAVLIGLLLARRLIRPLRAAAQAARRLSEGEREVRIAVEGPREIAEVTFALAELQTALAASEGRLRDFFMSISHELRTPLTSIKGYAEALKDGVVDDPSQVERIAVVMEEESERLDRLISDLLDLARMDAVDFVIVPEPIDFTEIGAQAARVWADRCRAEGVLFAAELPETPLLGSTDPVRVRQIIDNLAANALRLTPAGKPLVISVRELEVAVVPGQLGPGGSGSESGRPVPAGESQALGDSQTLVEIQVRDGGPGLTNDDCLVAFEPAELYSRYKGIRRVGTGIGLALVGRLARRLGGSAVAGTAPEGGASFTIRIARSLPVKSAR